MFIEKLIAVLVDNIIVILAAIVPLGVSAFLYINTWKFVNAATKTKGSSSWALAVVCINTRNRSRAKVDPANDRASCIMGVVLRRARGCGINLVRGDAF